MNTILLQFAVATEGVEEAGLFGSLGIDWTLLLMQTIAFLVLLAILRKWVYPPLLAMLDKRDKLLRDSTEAAVSAKKEAENAEKKTAALLKKARAEAGDIVATAREEATSVVEAAQKKATDKAEALVAAARDDIAKEVESARVLLHNETLNLVAEATGTVLGVKIDGKTDSKLIEKALKEAR